jgi:hypothetical protein
MTDSEDCARAALDIQITTLLAKAADTYASHAGIDRRLNAILAAGTEDKQGHAVAAERNA